MAAKRGIPSASPLNGRSFYILNRLDGLYARKSNLAAVCHADTVELFHMKGRVVPDLCAKTSGEHEGITCSGGVFKVELAVDDAADETVDVLEDD